MGWLNLIVKFVRLGPLGLGVIAVAILALGYFLQLNANKHEVLKAAALAAGPPELVQIDEFDRARDVTDLREVNIQAQILRAQAYRLTIEKDGTDDEGYMVPLVSPDARDRTEVLGVAMFSSPTDGVSTLTNRMIWGPEALIGPLGMVVQLNGQSKALGQFQTLTEDAFAEQGLVFPDNPIVVWPYLEGRGVAFAPADPADATIFGVLSKIAGVIGLLALAKLVFRPENDDGEALPKDAALSPDRAEALAAGQVSDFALQEHAFEEAVFEAPVAPQPAQFEPAPDMVASPKRGIAIYKGLVGLVALAFVVLLGATVYSLLKETAANAPAVEIVSTEQTMADRIAESVVPSTADPDRPFYEIDFAPVAQWFVAKAVMAADGDREAQMLLGGMIGGAFLLMFMLRWFVVMRLALHRRSSVHLRGMEMD